MNKSLLTGITLGCSLLLSLPVQARLIGTELSLSSLLQATPTSTPVQASFERTVIVSDSIVEFPDVASLFNPSTELPPGFASSFVDVAIDVGDDFIEIDFDNSAPFSVFASGYENTYVFKFDSTAIVDIVGAEIDTSLTTLGLVSSDISFIGNELFINVESLSFNLTTFARINLVVEGGPATIPVPTAVWLFGSGLIGLIGMRKKSAKFSA